MRTILILAVALLAGCSSSLTKHMEATGKIPEGVNMAYCYQIEGDSSGGIWTQTNVKGEGCKCKTVGNPPPEAMYVAAKVCKYGTPKQDE